ncbi:MAG: DUF4412 domain-containing protein [Clostridiales bacterium]|nr:DUF4412 domain-containing protein [Clostridiales bacterium]
MKKLIAATLVLVLAFFLAACGSGSSSNNSSNSSSTPPASTPGGSTGTPAAPPASSGVASGASAAPPASSSSGSGSSSGASGQAIASLIGWMSEGKFSFDFTMTAESADGSMEMTGSMAADGGKSAMTMEMSVMGMAIKQRIIMKDGKAYMIDDGNKSYMEMSLGEAVDSMTDFADLTPIGSGTGEINGRTLPYEDYKQADSDEPIRFYMDGDQVYGIETVAAGSKNVMIITNAKNSAPAGAFDIPADYKEGAVGLGGMGSMGGINLEDFLPDDFDMSDLELPEGFTMPEGFALPEGVTLPEGIKIPGM